MWKVRAYYRVAEEGGGNSVRIGGIRQEGFVCMVSKIFHNFFTYFGLFVRMKYDLFWVFKKFFNTLTLYPFNSIQAQRFL